jgi:hypothetical protein
MIHPYAIFQSSFYALLHLDHKKYYQASSFFWPYMTHINQYILVKLTYSSTILILYRIYREPVFFVFPDVSSLCQPKRFLFELISFIILSIYNLYHSIHKLLNIFYK